MCKLTYNLERKTLIGTVSWINQGNSNICDDAGILGDFLLFYLTFLSLDIMVKGKMASRLPSRTKKRDYKRPIP